MRIIHETSERDLKVREVTKALSELAAQIMRISAGAGDVARMGAALERLNEAIENMPDGEPTLTQTEAAEALDFRRYGPQDHENDVRYARDEVVRHALRLVAARYQGFSAHEATESSEIQDANWNLERERAHRTQQTPRMSCDEVANSLTVLTLSNKMREALAVIAGRDKSKAKGGRPHSNTLSALEGRGLVVWDGEQQSYRLTEKGARALETIESNPNQQPLRP